MIMSNNFPLRALGEVQPSSRAFRRRGLSPQEHRKITALLFASVSKMLEMGKFAFKMAPRGRHGAETHQNKQIMSQEFVMYNTASSDSSQD
jgi:hypothetical protein